MMKHITKEVFLNQFRCSKSAHLTVHHPELMEEEKDLLVMENARQFEQLAYKLIAPGGIDIKKDERNKNELATLTKKHLKKDSCTLYQATFITPSNELAMADIFIKAPFRTALIEVKSFTGPLKAETIYDVAYQYWVITQAGYKIDEVLICYVNSEYERDGEVTEEIFVIEDVTVEVRRIQPEVKALLSRLERMLNSKTAPEKEIGTYCVNPRPCAFKQYCWNHLPTNNIFELRGMRIGTKLKLYERDIVEFKDIPEKEMTDGQWIQVSCALENKVVSQPDKIKEWLSELNLDSGVGFLDFETYSTPIPDYGSPYTPIPFQFSFHFRNAKRERPQHGEFLADPHSTSDEQLLFLKELLRCTAKNPKSKILVWNIAFERSILNKLKERYPSYEKEIRNLIGRLEDLMIIFKEKWYYDARFKGSYSIKNVLPVLWPDLSYDELNIGDGSTASYEFLRMRKLTPVKAKPIQKSLLDYCSMDTLAMLRILEVLEREFLNT